MVTTSRESHAQKSHDIFSTHNRAFRARNSRSSLKRPHSSYISHTSHPSPPPSSSLLHITLRSCKTDLPMSYLITMQVQKDKKRKRSPSHDRSQTSATLNSREGEVEVFILSSICMRYCMLEGLIMNWQRCCRKSEFSSGRRLRTWWEEKGRRWSIKLLFICNILKQKMISHRSPIRCAHRRIPKTRTVECPTHFRDYGD